MDTNFGKYTNHFKELFSLLNLMEKKLGLRHSRTSRVEP